jgi:hypothetical protein
MNKIIQRDRVTGQITYKGIRLDMYLFCFYLSTLNYDKPRNKRITPKLAKLRHITQFLRLEGLI